MSKTKQRVEQFFLQPKSQPGTRAVAANAMLAFTAAAQRAVPTAARPRFSAFTFEHVTKAAEISRAPSWTQRAALLIAAPYLQRDITSWLEVGTQHRSCGLQHHPTLLTRASGMQSISRMRHCVAHVACGLLQRSGPGFFPRKRDVIMINTTAKLNILATPRSQLTVTSGHVSASCSPLHKRLATPRYCNARYAFQSGMLASYLFLGSCSAALALGGCTADVSATPEGATQELSSELRKAGDEAEPQAREGADSEARRRFPCSRHACPEGTHCEAPADRPTCVSNANAVCTSNRQCPLATLCCNPCGFHPPSDPETETDGFVGCQNRCLAVVSGMCPAIP
jgi:hypothetical protein